MPTYKMHCNKCNNLSEQTKKMSEPFVLICPACNKEGLSQAFWGYEVVVNDGVIRTWGQQSAYNYKQMGKTAYQEMVGPELERQNKEKLGPLGVDLDNPRAVEKYITEGIK